MRVAELLGYLTGALREAAGEEAAQQARLLAAHVLGVAPGALACCREQALTDGQQRQLEELLARRLQREPLQYLLGEWAFMGLPMRVRPGALIPRQDTETLAELALRMANAHGYRTALDLCCGSGCIGVALAALGGLRVAAADVSADCVALAAENAARNGVQLEVLQGSWFAPVHGRRFDLIVCNPPYLTAAEMDDLQPELAYEPRLALCGGADGLAAYRMIAQDYGSHLTPGGVLLTEVGAGQAEQVRAIFGGGESFPDVNGVMRVVRAG